jgi:hypothetical protein
MQKSAHAYGRALAVWGQWLRQYRHTRAPRALQTALACREIAAEKLAIWHADLKLTQSVIQANRAARIARLELCLDEIRQEIQSDERMLRETGLAAPEAMSPWPGDLAEEEPDTAQAGLVDIL